MPATHRTMSSALRIPFLTAAAFTLAALFPCPAAAPPKTADEFEFFEKRIRPVLAERCYECHSATSKKLKANLRLDSRDGMLKGGESGQPVIVPGDAARSRLIEALRQTNPDLQMPPRTSGKKLRDDQIADFVAWVNAGALAPKGSPKSKVQSPKSAAAKPHWAFTAPKEQAVPKVKETRWPLTPVDNFILAKLESNGLKPSPPADKFALLRRATYDLTGLPPTPAEVDTFLKDTAADAYPRLVERLLASPRYGERWGRHWLDVARYSDTKGYVYAREERFWVHAHAYRDWVIRAFNDDLPYDRFLLLQIAADQVVEKFNVPSSQFPVEPAPADLAAMGFLTLNRRFLGVTHDIVDDRIDVVTRGALGLTVACARCHDHKYDPIPTRDYYSLYGVFRSNTEEALPIASAPERTETYAVFEKELKTRVDKFNTTLAAHRDLAARRVRARAGDYLVAQLELQKYPEEGFDQVLTDKDIIPTFVRHWQTYLFHTGKQFDPVWAPWHTFAALAENEFTAKAPGALAKLLASSRAKLNPRVASAFAPPPASMRDVAERYGKLLADVNNEWLAALAAGKTNRPPPPAALADASAEALRQILYAADSPAVVPADGIVDTEMFFTSGECDALWKLQGEVDRHLIRTPVSPDYAVFLADREPKMNPRVFKRGNPAQKAEEVPRQFLEVIAGPKRQPFQHGSGRLELAQAIISPDNPLTARVMVNRIWLHHFGAGLVTTPSDFGRRAEPPSHPELLDWLARRFVAGKWSVKAMHRVLMLSATYQQEGEYSVFSVQSSVGEDLSKLGTLPKPSKANTEHLSRRARELDPANRLLSCMNRHRLEFEELRDSLLAVAGDLDPRMGGKPTDMFAAANQRRSVYGLVDRQFLPSVFRVFDFANPDLHIPQRHDTTVAQQALFFLNSPFVAERAKSLLQRPEVAAASAPREKLRQIYRAVYLRDPSASHLDAALNFVRAAEADVAALPPKPVATAWHYGFGEYDEPARVLKGFTPLPHFTGTAWQGGPQWPDAKLGWVQLTAAGGHAGNDLQHAAVRRWIAPRDATVAISGAVEHTATAGDGVRAFIAATGKGQLKTATVHNAKEEMKVATVEVKQGDTIDFIVDFRANLNSDEFKWAPVITASSATDGAKEWNAKQEFVGVPSAPPPPLPPWAQYAQVLLLANEFVFVD